jgi:proteasome assembly chaperone 3
MAASAALPLKTENFEADIAGRRTGFVVIGFVNRIMIVVTQLGTLGSVLHAEKETVLGGGSTYRVDTLVGRRDEPLAELCARQLAERLDAAGCDRQVLLCLALQRDALTPAAVKQVLQAVEQHMV